MSEEDFKYVSLCYDKFKKLYDKCPFIGISYCGSYGGFGYSEIIYKIHNKMISANKDKVLFSIIVVLI